MKYIDITSPIFNQMKKYPGDPQVKLFNFKSLKKGDSCNLLQLNFGSHTATHIDAPRHIIGDATTVDRIRIKDLICDVIVMNIGEIAKKKYSRKDCEGILLKCAGKKSGLSIGEAKILAKNKFKVVGIEGMSIEEDSKNKLHPVHRLLLSGGTIIIDGLNLKKVKTGYYKLICLPLKIRNGDGSPARAVLAYD